MGLIRRVIFSAAAFCSLISSGFGNDDLLSGTWTGEYRCGQGITAMQLTIERDRSGWDGVFSFGPSEQNPDIPSGSYRVDVDLDGDDVTIEPVAWIDQPDGYGMAGSYGTLSSDRNEIVGRVDHSSCGRLAVKRDQPYVAEAPVEPGEIEAASPPATETPATGISKDDLAFYSSSNEPVVFPRRSLGRDDLLIFSSQGLRLYMTGSRCDSGFVIETDSPDLTSNIADWVYWEGVFGTWAWNCTPRSPNVVAPIYYLGEQIGSAHVQADPGTYGASNWRAAVDLEAEPQHADDRAQRIAQMAIDATWRRSGEEWNELGDRTKRILAERNASLSMTFYYRGETKGDMPYHWRDRSITPALQTAARLGDVAANYGLSQWHGSKAGFDVGNGAFDPSVVYGSENVAESLPKALCYLGKAVASRDFDAMQSLNRLQENGAEVGEALGYVASNGGALADCEAFGGDVPAVAVALRDQPCAADRPNLAPFPGELDESSHALILNKTCSSDFIRDNSWSENASGNALGPLFNSAKPNGGRCTFSNFGLSVDVNRQVSNVQCGPASNGRVECTAALNTYCGPQGGDLRQGGYLATPDGMACAAVTGGENYISLPTTMVAEYDSSACAWSVESLTIAGEVTFRR